MRKLAFLLFCLLALSACRTPEPSPTPAPPTAAATDTPAPTTTRTNGVQIGQSWGPSRRRLALPD